MEVYSGMDEAFEMSTNHTKRLWTISMIWAKSLEIFNFGLGSGPSVITVVFFFFLIQNKYEFSGIHPAFPKSATDKYWKYTYTNAHHIH